MIMKRARRTTELRNTRPMILYRTNIIIIIIILSENKQVLRRKRDAMCDVCGARVCTKMYNTLLIHGGQIRSSTRQIY